MQKATIYRCDVCGAQYKTPKECKSCEEFHVNMSQLKFIAFKPMPAARTQYPEALIAEMEDGATVAYAFTKVIEEPHKQEGPNVNPETPVDVPEGSEEENAQ